MSQLIIMLKIFLIKDILKKSLGEDHYNTKFALKGINELQEKMKEQDHE